MWPVLSENRAPPSGIGTRGHLFKLAFWRLTLSTPKRCVLVNGSTGSHSSLFSLTSTSPICKHHTEKEWAAFSYPWCFFSGGLPFAFYSVRLKAVVQLFRLNRCFMRVALSSAHCPPVWLPQLLSYWSGSRTVPLTLALRLLASAELELSTGPASPAWSSQEPSDLRGLDQDDPPLAWCRMSL